MVGSKRERWHEDLLDEILDDMVTLIRAGLFDETPAGVKRYIETLVATKGKTILGYPGDAVAYPVLEKMLEVAREEAKREQQVEHTPVA